jgi:quinol monooxygenase YgiN
MMQADDGVDHESQKKFMCIATFLPLKSWRYMIPFQLMTSKVLKQIRRNEGVINYAVKANFLKRHFWTFSIWKDHNSLRQFVMSEPHATAVKKFSEWVGEGSAFVEWSSQSEVIDWREAFKKLQEPPFYYNKE